MAEDKIVVGKALEDLSLEELLKLKKGQVVEVDPRVVILRDTSPFEVFERTYTVRVAYMPHGKKGCIESVDVSEGVGKTHNCVQTRIGEAYRDLSEIKVP